LATSCRTSRFPEFPIDYLCRIVAYGHSSSGSETCADPVAWYYYHTGIEDFRDIVIQFQETGVPGFDGTQVVAGDKPYYALDQVWTGDWVGN
jgi:hypothetical protein